MPTNEYEIAKARAVNYLASHSSITNRILRTVAPVNYDQAIYVFGRMCEEGILKRHGNAGGTHYTLANARKG